MTAGHLTPKRLAVVPIVVDGTALDAVVDTGFDGGLQLPDVMATVVQRAHLRQEGYQYPDGRVVTYDIYLVGVELGGEDVVTEAIFSPSDEVLVGSKLLADYRLTIDYPAGVVTLERTRP